MVAESSPREVPLTRLPVGSRKVGKINNDPIIYLGKDFRWLIGKRVYVEIIVRG
ncbi:MAG: hypothetical protein GSR81_06045 [Desulfurococcales archaeon]|nr:hypothetical protein [Desulfurococcales archaeon]